MLVKKNFMAENTPRLFTNPRLIARNWNLGFRTLKVFLNTLELEITNT